jgi:signal transduction histidine kinase
MNMPCSQTATAKSAAGRDGFTPELWRQLPVGLGVFDAKLLLECCNPAFARLCGGTVAELQGSYLLRLLPLEEDRLPSMMAALKLRGRWQGIAHDERLALRIEMTRQAHADGSSFYPISVIDYAEDFRQLRELSAARDLAEKTDQAKSRFLSHMSHELRTPLNAILGFTQLMQISPDLPAVQQDNLREIESAGSYLLGLINEILDLSRIEAGNLRLNAEALALEQLIRECLVLTRPLAERKQVDISIDCSITQPLLGDQVRLKQVLLNLLSNAVKYNRHGGKVFIHCSDEMDGRLRIEIRDDGPGIRADVQASIFSPFARLAADARGSDSSGIGLMITRRLVQLMGGRIGLCSEPGRGSVFWLELPGPTGEACSAPQLRPGAGAPLLYSIGNDLAWNGLLARLQPLRPGLRLRNFDALPEAMSQLETEAPACLLLNTTCSASAMEPQHAVLLKNTLLVAVEHQGQGVQEVTDSRGDSTGPYWQQILPAGHSLHDLLTLIDSLAPADKEQALP